MQLTIDLYGSGATETFTVQKPVLRDYQTAGIREVSRLASSGVKRILFVMPTGGGKTVVAASMIEGILSVGKRVLFMAHRTELINQTAKQLAMRGITDIGVVIAQDKRANPKAMCQVASVDTLRNRDAGDFQVIMIDECHRAESATYKLIQSRYQNALSIGFTATPFRLDNKGLGNSYDEMVVAAKPSLLISNGSILCPTIFSAPELPDMTDVSISMSDFSSKGAGAAMRKPKLMGHIIREWKEHAGNRRTVAFCVNVEHAEELSREFNEAGIPAAVVHAGTAPAARALTLQRLRNHEVSVVCNVDVLTEGWDQPEVKVAILARPTMSLRVHLQQCGRVLRPFGDETALLLDHAGNCQRHGLPQWDIDYHLDDGRAPTRASTLSVRVCEKCFCTYDGRGSACPACQHVPPKKEANIAANQGVQLQRLDPTKVFTEADRQRDFFSKQMSRAKSQGFKPGYAAAQWKEKYGRWPPYEWSRHAQAAYDKDPEWQQNLTDRLWRKEVYAGRSAQGTDKPKDTPSKYTVDPEDDIPF